MRTTTTHSVLLPVSPALTNVGGVGTTVGRGATEEVAFGQGNDSAKWGWYAWGCIAYLVIVYQLAIGGRDTVAKKDGKTKAFYGSIAGFTLILWTIYPIIWGISEGAHIISVDAEILAYAVLDVLAKPVFGFWLLFTHDSMSSTSPSVEGFWAHGFGDSGTLRVGDED